MKRIRFILIAAVLALTLVSCAVNPDDIREDPWLHWTRDIFEQAYGEEFTEAYDDALDRYEQSYEYLNENKEELADELKKEVAGMVDDEGMDPGQAEAVKEGSIRLIDWLTQIIFHDSFDPVWPAATYDVNTLYCYKDTSITGSIYHSCHNSYLTGIDIGPSGQKDVEIYAVEDGEVILSEYSTTSGFGNWIKIQHEDGMVSVYAHLAERHVEKGDTVSREDVIGIMGNSSAKYSLGTHLHFELADENGSGDAWLEYYKDKYKKELRYESNVITNNERNNSGHVVSSWIREHYEKISGSTYYRWKG